MSVLKNSVNRSNCLYCKTSNLTTEYHDIFDEIGLELQLPSLVRKFFGIEVESTENKQLLCQDCVNQLIEHFDLEEHCKEASALTEECQNITILNETDQDEKVDHNKTAADKDLLEFDARISESSPNETEQGQNNEFTKSSSQETQEQDNNNVELSTSYDYLLENTQVILNSRNAAEFYNIVNSTEEILKVDDESVSTIYKQGEEVDEQELVNESDINYVESEFADDNIDVVPDASGVLYDHIDYETEDYTDTAAVEVLSNAALDQMDKKEQISNDDLLNLEGIDRTVENDVYEEVIVMENNQFEELDNEYLQIENVVKDMSSEVYSQSTQESLSNAITVERDENSISMDVIDEGSLQDKDEIEEEYLIEEIIGSEEYDNVDLNEYLDNALATTFEDLQIKWNVECKLCLHKHNSLQQLLNHPCVDEVREEGQCSCVINDCDEIFEDFNSLARHLVIKHYDNVESLAIYGRCPDCQKAFSNITDFNKHSCCKIKRKAGTRNFCQSCNLDFQSLKRYVFHMQFHLTKHRPKVCILCGAKFNNADDFFDHVQYSHEPDTAMACIKCDRFFKEKSVFEQHMLCHDFKYEFECRHCPKKYTNRSGLTSHMDICHNHEMKSLQCEYCYKEFVNQSSYRNHMKIHMPEAKVPAYICSVCGLVSNSVDIIQDHLENDEASLGFTGEVIEKILSVVFTCECCSIDFFSTQYLQQHRKSPKHNEQIFYCPLCRKAFKTLKHMRNHMTSHKDYDEWLNEFPIERLYMCNIGDCQDAYPLWSSLYYHKKRHNNVEVSGDPLQCQFCKKVCTTKMSLAIHVVRVHNNNNIKCPHCHKSYKNEKELKKHIEHIHVSMQCSKCQKVFKNRRNLISHEQLVHKRVKRYFCSHCKKGYYYKSELQAHVKNVHPETSYKCQLCNFVTNYPKSLDIHHVAKHTTPEDLPFKCKNCSKGFAQKKLLDLHLKRHKADKDFICYEYCEGGCNASFITHFLLKKHIETKHPSKGNQVSNESRAQSKKTKDKNGNDAQKQLLVIEGETGGDMELIFDENDDDMGSDEEYEVHYDQENCDADEDEIVEELEDENEDMEVEMEA